MTIKNTGIDRRDFLGMAAGAGVAAVLRRNSADAASAWPDQEVFSFAVIADPHCAEGPRKGME